MFDWGFRSSPATLFILEDRCRKSRQGRYPKLIRPPFLVRPPFCVSEKKGVAGEISTAQALGSTIR